MGMAAVGGREPVATHHYQARLSLVVNMGHTTLPLPHRTLCRIRGQELVPVQTNYLQSVQAVVVAVPMIAVASKVIERVRDAGAGVTKNSKRRLACGGKLLPVTTEQVEDLHAGGDLTLLLAAVNSRHQLLLSTPQVQLVSQHDRAVTEPC